MKIRIVLDQLNLIFSQVFEWNSQCFLFNWKNCFNLARILWNLCSKTFEISLTCHFSMQLNTLVRIISTRIPLSGIVIEMTSSIWNASYFPPTFVKPDNYVLAVSIFKVWSVNIAFMYMIASGAKEKINIFLSYRLGRVRWNQIFWRAGEKTSKEYERRKKSYCHFHLVGFSNEILFQT